MYLECMGILSLVLAIAGVPVGTGLLARALFGRSHTPHSIRGLLFHSVTDSSSAGFSHCRRDIFAQYARLISQDNIRTFCVTEAARQASDVSGCCLTFDDGFSDFYELVLPILSRYQLKATIFPVTGFIGNESSWDIFPQREHLSIRQLREISDAGHEIGSHTVTHPDLTLLSPADLDRELRDSKATLEDITGKQVTSLSFPCGRWNSSTWKAAQEAGYTSATIYTRHRHVSPGTIPVFGTYAFDTADDLYTKTRLPREANTGIARARIMPHYAKGTSLWLYRREYSVL